MPRTKPTEARDKILRAERIRLQQLKLDAEFQRDMKQLESIAKRLAAAAPGLIPVSKLPEVTEKQLLPTADEARFRDLAAHFKQNWNFQARWNGDGKVELSILMPAGGYKMLPSGEVIETTRRGKHPDSYVDGLAKYDRSLRQRFAEKRQAIRAYMEAHSVGYQTARAAVEKAGLKKAPHPRRRIDTDQQRLKARQLHAQGKTIQQIAIALFPAEYRACNARYSASDTDKYNVTGAYGLYKVTRHSPLRLEAHIRSDFRGRWTRPLHRLAIGDAATGGGFGFPRNSSQTADQVADIDDPGNGIPVFYSDELPALKNKPAATLRKIYATKKAFGPGTRVRR
jgi:hypothetical protein